MTPFIRANFAEHMQHSLVSQQIVCKLEMNTGGDATSVRYSILVDARRGRCR